MEPDRGLSEKQVGSEKGLEGWLVMNVLSKISWEWPLTCSACPKSRALA